MCCALFVAHEEVVKLRLAECGVERKDGAAGIAESLAHAKTRERFAKDFCTGKLHGVLACEPDGTGAEKVAGTAVIAPREDEETSKAYLAITPLEKRGWGRFHAARRFLIPSALRSKIRLRFGIFQFNVPAATIPPIGAPIA